jgi:hypothetical protein
MHAEEHQVLLRGEADERDPQQRTADQVERALDLRRRDPPRLPAPGPPIETVETIEPAEVD